jgi:hypothetical protein
MSTVAVVVAAALAYIQPFAAYREEAAPSADGLRYGIERDRAQLVAAIELYTLQRSRPPGTLQDLLLDDWIPTETLARCREQFEYRVTGRRWSLEERAES